MDFLEILRNIIQDGIELGLIWSLMTLGIFISFRVLDFADLTVEGTVTLGAGIAISMLNNGAHPLVSTLVALLGGFAAGIFTGILHAKLRIPAILAGIITMTGLYTINLRVMGSAFIGTDRDTLYAFFGGFIDNPFLSKAITALLVVVIFFFLLYWFFGTEIGMSIRATGMNQKMARAQGINTHVMIILGLALANALVAVSGALSAQSMRGANMDIGRGSIVIGLASIIIGEVIFGKRTFKNWLISVILGSIIYQCLVAVAIALDMNPNDLKLLQAILIAFILSLPLLRKTKLFRKKEVTSNA